MSNYKRDAQTMLWHYFQLCLDNPVYDNRMEVEGIIDTLQLMIQEEIQDTLALQDAPPTPKISNPKVKTFTDSYKQVTPLRRELITADQAVTEFLQQPGIIYVDLKTTTYGHGEFSQQMELSQDVALTLIYREVEEK